MKTDKNEQKIRLIMSNLPEYLNALEIVMMREEQKNAELDEMSQ